ncbi:MAG: hypothetical protein ACRDRU_02420 [Pseudonocardiaceae bacterium]
MPDPQLLTKTPAGGRSATRELLRGKLDDAAAEIDAGDWADAAELARRYLPDDRT